MNKVATIISVVFHPLLMTTYLVLILGCFFPRMLLVPQDKLWIFAGLIFIITFLLPVLNIMIFKQFNIITSVTMIDRKDRIFPFIFIATLYILVAVLFVYRIHLSGNFTKLMIITTSLVSVACIITFFYKLSIHAMAIWGLIGILLPLNKLTGQSLLLITCFLIAAAGVVMASRLKLNAHSPREILTGALTGFAIGFGGMVLLF